MTAQITTIIPTYQRPAMLRRAIESALSQSLGEIIVKIWDNGGDQLNAAVAASFKDPRIEYFRHSRNLGAFANFQAGIQNVDTPFFSVLADDDVLLPNFYKTALAELAAEPQAAFAAAPVVRIDGQGRTLAVDGAGWPPGVYPPPHGLLTMLERGHINWVGILFRRSALETVPELDQETAPSFDLDFELRLAAQRLFVICAEPGAVMVQHENSVSAAARLSDTWPAFLKIIDNASGAAGLTPEVREQTRRALERQLASRIYRIGRAAARQGQVDLAEHAARVIVERYGWRSRAALIRLTARTCAALPPARTGLRLGLDAYRGLRSWQLCQSLGIDYGANLRRESVMAPPVAGLQGA